MANKKHVKKSNKIQAKGKRKVTNNVKAIQSPDERKKELPSILKNTKENNKTYEKKLQETKEKFSEESKIITSKFNNKMFDGDHKTKGKISIFQNFKDSSSFPEYSRTNNSKHETPVELLYKASCTAFSDAYDGLLAERISDVMEESNSTDFKIAKYKDDYSKFKKRWDTVITNKSKEKESKNKSKSFHDVTNQKSSVRSVKSLPTHSSVTMSEKLNKSTDEDDLKGIRKDLALKEIMTMITSFKRESEISSSESETLSDTFITDKFLKYEPSKILKSDVQTDSSSRIVTTATDKSIEYREQTLHTLSEFSYRNKDKIIPLASPKTTPYVTKKKESKTPKKNKLKSRSHKKLNITKQSGQKFRMDEISMKPSPTETSIVAFKSNNGIPIALEYLMQIAEAIYYNACHETYSSSSKNCEQVAATYRHLMTFHEPHVLISEEENRMAQITVISRTNMHIMKLPFNIKKYLKVKLNIHVSPGVKLDRPVLIREGMRFFLNWKNYQFPTATIKKVRFVEHSVSKLQALSKTVPETKDLKQFVNVEIKHRPIFHPEPIFKYIRGTEDIDDWLIREQQIENKNILRKISKLEENLENKKREKKMVLRELEKKRNLVVNHKCGCETFSGFVTEILWKASKEKKIVNQFMISHELGCFIYRNVIQDYVSFVNMQLSFYRENSGDKSTMCVCVDIDQDQFILRLCAIVNNIIAAAPLNYLQFSKKEGKELISNIIKILYTSGLCSSEFKRILLSILYNLNFHQLSRDIILNNPDILKCFTIDQSQDTPEDLRLLTLKLAEFLTWNIQDISNFKKFLDLLPLLKDVYRNEKHSSELKILINCIVSNFREAKKKFIFGCEENVVNDTSHKPIIC